MMALRLRVYTATDDEAIVIGNLLRTVAAFEWRYPDAIEAKCVGDEPLARYGIEALPALQLDDRIVCQGALPSFDQLRIWVRTLPEELENRGDEQRRRQRAPWSLVETPAGWVRLRLEDRRDEIEDTRRLIRLADGAPRRYFPAGMLSSHPRTDACHAIGFTSCLLEFGEHPFTSGRPGTERYRLLHTRSVLGPILIRIENEGMRTRFIWKLLFCPDTKEMQQGSRELTRFEAPAVNSVLRISSFWKLPAEGEWPLPDYFDYSDYLFESALGSRYRAVMRFQGDELRPIIDQLELLFGRPFTARSIRGNVHGDTRMPGTPR